MTLGHWNDKCNQCDSASPIYVHVPQTKYISNETNEIQLNTRPSTDQHVQPSNMDLSPAGVNKKPKKSKLSGVDFREF